MSGSALRATGGAWGGIEHVAELGTLVDVSRTAKGRPRTATAATIPSWTRFEPLSRSRISPRLVFQMPEGWNPVADFGDLGELGAAAIAEGLGA